jgi:pimeloyl-ACP methyl ester carboxylesterase
MPTEPTERQDALLRRLVPQPLALFVTKIDAPPLHDLPMPKAVVFCRDDASLPPGAFLGMAQALGDYTLVEIDGSHEALVTNPSDVAKGILQVAG